MVDLKSILRTWNSLDSPDNHPYLEPSPYFTPSDPSTAFELYEEHLWNKDRNWAKFKRKVVHELAAKQWDKLNYEEKKEWLDLESIDKERYHWGLHLFSPKSTLPGRVTDVSRVTDVRRVKDVRRVTDYKEKKKAKNTLNLTKDRDLHPRVIRRKRVTGFKGGKKAENPLNPPKGKDLHPRVTWTKRVTNYKGEKKTENPLNPSKGIDKDLHPRATWIKHLFERTRPLNDTNPLRTPEPTDGRDIHPRASNRIGKKKEPVNPLMSTKANDSDDNAQRVVRFTTPPKSRNRKKISEISKKISRVIEKKHLRILLRNKNPEISKNIQENPLIPSRDIEKQGRHRHPRAYFAAKRTENAQLNPLRQPEEREGRHLHPRAKAPLSLRNPENLRNPGNLRDPGTCPDDVENPLGPSRSDANEDTKSRFKSNPIVTSNPLLGGEAGGGGGRGEERGASFRRRRRVRPHRPARVGRKQMDKRNTSEKIGKKHPHPLAGHSSLDSPFRKSDFSIPSPMLNGDAGPSHESMDATERDGPQDHNDVTAQKADFSIPSPMLGSDQMEGHGLGGITKRDGSPGHGFLGGTERDGGVGNGVMKREEEVRHGERGGFCSGSGRFLVNPRLRVEVERSDASEGSSQYADVPNVKSSSPGPTPTAAAEKKENNKIINNNAAPDMERFPQLTPPPRVRKMYTTIPKLKGGRRASPTWDILEDIPSKPSSLNPSPLVSSNKRKSRVKSGEVTPSRVTTGGVTPFLLNSDQSSLDKTQRFSGAILRTRNVQKHNRSPKSDNMSLSGYIKDDMTESSRIGEPIQEDSPPEEMPTREAPNAKTRTYSKHKRKISLLTPPKLSSDSGSVSSPQNELYGVLQKSGEGEFLDLRWTS